MAPEPIDAYNAYSAAWHEMDAHARAELLQRAWSEEGVFVRCLELPGPV